MKWVIERSGVTNRPEDLEADRERIRKGWTQVAEFDGITGLTTINAERDGAGKATVLVVKDGAFTKVDY
jgi:branched-chain amino acid transport system substrate-binding protein